MFFDVNWEITEILDDIILGRGIKQCVHDLEYGEAVFTSLFIERLRLYRFHPMILNEVHINTSIRVPAFYISGKTAIFGHVFWEIFSEKKKRKLWGSTVRNEKGDWKYVLNSDSKEVLFVNMSSAEEFDLLHSV